jgi:hypothetical protein
VRLALILLLAFAPPKRTRKPDVPERPRQSIPSPNAPEPPRGPRPGDRQVNPM